MVLMSHERMHVKDQELQGAKHMSFITTCPTCDSTVSSIMDEDQTRAKDLLQTRLMECALMRQEFIMGRYEKNTLSGLQTCKPLDDILVPLYNWVNPKTVFEKVISHATSFKWRKNH